MKNRWLILKQPIDKFDFYKEMKIFKFGGASVKDAEAVKNAASILKKFVNEEIVVIVSAGQNNECT